jgi:hypothetical protein
MDLFGIGPIAAVAKSILEMFPNAEQRAAAANKLQDLAAQVAAQQSATNTAEAGHQSLFVAGWRPFCGWAFAFGTVYGILIQPILVGICTIAGLPAPPAVDVSTLVGLLTGLLGLGGLRTFEKTKK